jgi:peptidoglycan/LPS O-acetylase OafA/YrhL
MTGFDLRTHNVRLQSLRGLAALSVAIGHTALCVDNSSQNLAIFTTRILFQSNTAVIFFFVLSGLVLGSSLQRMTSVPLGRRLLTFSIRRIFRLVPVAILSLLFAAAVFKLLEGRSIPGMAPWFQGYFHVPLTFENLIKNMLFTEMNINGVLWSIRVELLVIPFLPLFAMLMATTSLAVDIVLIGTLFTIPWFFLPTGNSLGAQLYLFCFYTGMCLYKFSGTNAAGIITRGDFLLGTVAVVVVAEILWLLGNLPIACKYLVDDLAAAQILLFVMLRTEAPALRILEIEGIKQLGDVSYSFYAFGLAITVGIFFFVFQVVSPPAAFGHLYGFVAVFLVSAIQIIITFVFSIFLFRRVETPSIKVGRALSLT